MIRPNSGRCRRNSFAICSFIWPFHISRMRQSFRVISCLPLRLLLICLTACVILPIDLLHNVHTTCTCVIFIVNCSLLSLLANVSWPLPYTRRRLHSTPQAVYYRNHRKGDRVDTDYVDGSCLLSNRHFFAFCLFGSAHRHSLRYLLCFLYSRHIHGVLCAM